MRFLSRILVFLGAGVVVGILVWQGVTAAGSPDPVTPHAGQTAAIIDIGVLVFREGLECVLVLAAITASLRTSNSAHQRPIVLGAAAGFTATLLTWFVATGIIRSLTENISALQLQAATGLLAVVVLLVVMNWFFHKLYWGKWISIHNRRKKELLNARGKNSRSQILWGLGLLGFTSLYREGFEVVLFLQGYYLRLGQRIVLTGAALGLALSGIVALLTFLANRHLPYRQMLIFTGLMLGLVLLVMVGEQAQEMQLAHWIPTTPISGWENRLPAWLGLWFSIFPTVETLLAQLLALILVVGSYLLVRHGDGISSAR